MYIIIRKYEDGSTEGVYDPNVYHDENVARQYIADQVSRHKSTFGRLSHYKPLLLKLAKLEILPTTTAEQIIAEGH